MQFNIRHLDVMTLFLFYHVPDLTSLSKLAGVSSTEAAYTEADNKLSEIALAIFMNFIL